MPPKGKSSQKLLAELPSLLHPQRKASLASWAPWAHVSGQAEAVSTCPPQPVLTLPIAAQVWSNSLQQYLKSVSFGVSLKSAQARAWECGLAHGMVVAAALPSVMPLCAVTWCEWSHRCREGTRWPPGRKNVRTVRANYEATW